MSRELATTLTRIQKEAAIRETDMQDREDAARTLGLTLTIEERAQLIAERAQSYNDAVQRRENDLAAAQARRTAVIGWLADNSTAIIADYNRLLSAFFTKDAATVAEALASCGDRLSIVLSIPVYESDAVTKIDFGKMAAALFPEDTELQKLCDSGQGLLPETVMQGQDAASFPLSAESSLIRVSSKVENGYLPAKDRIIRDMQLRKLTELLDGEKEIETDRQQAVKVTDDALDRAIVHHLDTVSQTAARHFALLHAFERADAKSILASIDGLEKDNISARIFAHGTMREDIPSFTALALHTFAAQPEKASQIYCALLERDHEPQPAIVVQQTLTDSLPLPAAALRDTLRAMEKSGGASAVRNFALEKDINGVPLLARALPFPDAMAVIIEAFAGNLAQAGILRASAAMTANKTQAEALLDKAHMTAGGDWLNLNDATRIRLADIDYAENTGKSMRIWTRDSAHTVTADENECAEICARIAEQPRIVTAEKSYLAIDTLCAMSVIEEAEDFVKVRLSMKNIERPFLQMSLSEMEDFLDALKKRDGILILDKSAINLGVADTIKFSNADGGDHDFEFHVGAKQFSVKMSSEKAGQAIDALRGNDAFFVTDDGAIALDRAVDICYMTDPAQDGTETDIVTIGSCSGYGENTTLTASREAAQRLISEILPRRDFIIASENQAVHPRHIKLLMNRKDINGTLSVTFTAASSPCYIPCAEPQACDAMTAAIAAANPGLLEIKENLWIDPATVAAVQNNEGAHQNIVVSLQNGESWALKDTDRQSLEAAMQKFRQNGFMAVDYKTLVNPALVTAMTSTDITQSETVSPQDTSRTHSVTVMAGGKKHNGMMDGAAISRLMNPAP